MPAWVLREEDEVEQKRKGAKVDRDENLHVDISSERLVCFAGWRGQPDKLQTKFQRDLSE